MITASPLANQPSSPPTPPWSRRQGRCLWPWTSNARVEPTKQKKQEEKEEKKTKNNQSTKSFTNVNNNFVQFTIDRTFF
jgi:hypothetical protein